MELTYRCNLNCIHCYCQGYEGVGRELDTGEIMALLDALRAEGSLWLTLTGGEPLIREDFLEIYAYARKSGFLVSIFTNGHLFTPEIVRYLVKSPPYSIEITLNGISEKVYEEISQVKGSLMRVIENIRILVKNNLPVIIKTNVIKQNAQEIVRIKAWAEDILGSSEGKYRFKYDPFIHPRLNGDKTPLKYRLSFREVFDAIKDDPDMLAEHMKEMRKKFPRPQAPSEMLYHCDCSAHQAFINPYGILKFCQLSEKFSFNLRKTSFHDSFYQMLPRISKETFKTDTPCRDCASRKICQWCPAKALLETGDEESPIPFYCELAGDITAETHKARREAASV